MSDSLHYSWIHHLSVLVPLDEKFERFHRQLNQNKVAVARCSIRARRTNGCLGSLWQRRRQSFYIPAVFVCMMVPGSSGARLDSSFYWSLEWKPPALNPCPPNKPVHVGITNWETSGGGKGTRTSDRVGTVLQLMCNYFPVWIIQRKPGAKQGD